MKITFYTKNIKLTPEIEDYTRTKINALEHFIKKILDVRVELGYNFGQRSSQMYRIEVNLRVPEQYLIRGEKTGSSVYEVIDLVIPKLKKEIEKYKEKMARRTEKKRFWSFFKTFGQKRKGRSRF